MNFPLETIVRRLGQSPWVRYVQRSAQGRYLALASAELADSADSTIVDALYRRLEMGALARVVRHDAIVTTAQRVLERLGL